MVERNEKGRLQLRSLDMQIFMGDLFEKCENEHEIDWLEDQLTEYAACLADERRDEIGRTD